MFCLNPTSIAEIRVCMVFFLKIGACLVIKCKNTRRKFEVKSEEETETNGLQYSLYFSFHRKEGYFTKERRDKKPTAFLKKQTNMGFTIDLNQLNESKAQIKEYLCFQYTPEVTFSAHSGTRKSRHFIFYSFHFLS